VLDHLAVEAAGYVRVGVVAEDGDRGEGHLRGGQRDEVRQEIAGRRPGYLVLDLYPAGEADGVARRDAVVVDVPLVGHIDVVAAIRRRFQSYRLERGHPGIGRADQRAVPVDVQARDVVEPLVPLDGRLHAAGLTAEGVGRQVHIEGEVEAVRRGALRYAREPPGRAGTPHRAAEADRLAGAVQLERGPVGRPGHGRTRRYEHQDDGREHRRRTR
jgi:hypothetical protein